MNDPTFLERSAAALRDRVQLVDAILAGLLAFVTPLAVLGQVGRPYVSSCGDRGLSGGGVGEAPADAAPVRGCWGHDDRDDPGKPEVVTG